MVVLIVNLGKDYLYWIDTSKYFSLYEWYGYYCDFLYLGKQKEFFMFDFQLFMFVENHKK